MGASKKRRKLLVLGIIALVLIGMVTWTMLSKHEAVITVETEKVKRRNLTEIVMSNGQIQPVDHVKISPEVSGEIIELPVKEGDSVKKGDLLVKIKPEYYAASRDSAKASYESSLAGKVTSEAELKKSEADFVRNKQLYERNLISEAEFISFQTSYEIAKSRVVQAEHSVAMAKAALDRAEEDLSRTTIYAPRGGTVTRLNSRVGERVSGTGLMAGTDIMTIANLDQMEARVDIGEMDIVLIKPGQKVNLEVDAFRDQKFKGVVSEIANSAKGSGNPGGQGDATKFEVKVRINEKEAFRPGMSVTAEIETRYSTNAIAVPIGCVTARVLPNTQPNKQDAAASPDRPTNEQASASSAIDSTNRQEVATSTNGEPEEVGSEEGEFDKTKKDEKKKPSEIVWVVENDKVKAVPVKLGISDDDYWEITEGLEEGVEIVVGNYRAINRDLKDGMKIVRKSGRPGGKQDQGKGD